MPDEVLAASILTLAETMERTRLDDRDLPEGDTPGAIARDNTGYRYDYWIREMEANR